MKSRREVLQIAIDNDGKILALCDDNTIWRKENQWQRIADVPGSQPKPAAPPELVED